MKINFKLLNQFCPFLFLIAIVLFAIHAFVESSDILLIIAVVISIYCGNNLYQNK